MTSCACTKCQRRAKRSGRASSPTVSVTGEQRSLQIDERYLPDFGVNAMQWPCGLISPSTIWQVPRAFAVLPGMN